MSVKIRQLKKEDVPRAAFIVRQNYSAEFGRLAKGEIAEMFRKGTIKPTYFGAEKDGKLVGFAGYMQSWMDYGVYHIFWVNVTATEQGRGIGGKLVAKIISEIRRQKGANLILISTQIPAYYEKKFKFKNLNIKSGKSYTLMMLQL